MRAWIEWGFKDTKGGGWNWHHTKMEEAARAERHWLVMAVATLWVVSVGGEVDAQHPAVPWQPCPRPIALAPATRVARSSAR